MPGSKRRRPLVFLRSLSRRAAKTAAALPVVPAALVIVGALTACGSGTPAVVAIDCTWLHGHNCWKAVVAAFAACSPPDGPAEGTFSADRKACQYPSGDTVTFTASIANPPAPPFNFSVGTCVTVEESDANETIVSVSSRAGVAKLQKKAASVEVSCPDGSLNIADLGAGSPLIGCNNAESLLPDTYFSNYEGPDNLSSFGFRGADTASFTQAVWRCH